jgi:hypothetical protein
MVSSDNEYESEHNYTVCVSSHLNKQTNSLTLAIHNWVNKSALKTTCQSSNYDFKVPIKE